MGEVGGARWEFGDGMKGHPGVLGTVSWINKVWINFFFKKKNEMTKSWR